MNFQTFQYRLPMDGQPEDMNRWLAGNRIVSVTHHIVQSGSGALLVFVVESVGAVGAHSNPETRVDYKETLSEENFKIFSRLRELRKELAQKEGVPVYAIFSNAHLAAMAKGRISNATDLSKIEGVGQARVEKYGAAFLALLTSLQGGEDKG